jgi:hypothetical protein
MLDQRGVAERFLSEGQSHKIVHFHIPLDISDFPTRHNYLLGLWQKHIERVELIDAKYEGPWELPALGPVTAPTAALVRPDGYVAWVGNSTPAGLVDALTLGFGSPAA